MSSNVQTQINDLNAAVQALDSSLTQITGNTMSNYNQLSRIVSQQANIYNSVYYGAGDINSRNLSVNTNALISGNLVVNGIANIDNGLIYTDPINNLVGINTTTPTTQLNVVGGANIGAGVWRLHLAKTMDTSSVGCSIRGADSSGNSIIQAEEQGVANRRLFLNPAGGGISIHSLNTDTSYALDVTGNTIIRGQINQISDQAILCNNGPYNFELATSAAGAYIDFHTSTSTTNDYDSRILTTGGTSATGQGNIQIESQNIIISGNMGIKNGNPQSTLDITGDTRISGNIFSQSGIIGNPSSYGIFMNRPNIITIGVGNIGVGIHNFGSGNTAINPEHFGVSWRNLLLCTEGGSVGIGTTTPTAKLQVNGDAVINQGVYATRYLSILHSTVNYNLDGGGSVQNITVSERGIYFFSCGSNYNDVNLMTTLMLSFAGSVNPGRVTTIINPGFNVILTDITNGFSISARYPPSYTGFHIRYIHLSL
jgi:hypothetical protein